MSLKKLAEMIQGEWNGIAAHFYGISTDTRHIEAGDLFIALSGDNFDGHDYVEQAIQNGASSIVVSRPVDVNYPTIVVEDTLKAYGDIAALHRQNFHCPIIAITGSCGKTSVKELTRNILSQKGKVLSSEANYNNEIGLPLTLLRLNPSHQYAVLEMGATKSGDIAYLAEIAQPTIRVVTNAAPAHLETMGSLENIAHTKGEMFATMGDGIAVINRDDPFCALWEKKAKDASQILTFGLNESDVKAQAIESHQGVYSFKLLTPKGQVHIQLAVPGEHQVMNALAASACAMAAGASLEDIQKGLALPLDTTQRLQKFSGKQGSEVWDDSYNAILPAVKSALKVLAQSQKDKIFVFGDMLELGTLSQDAHQEIGHEARKLGINQLYAVGQESRATVEAFGQGGHHFSTHDALIEGLQSQLNENTCLLVKGSRGMTMEKITQAIIDHKESKHVNLAE